MVENANPDNRYFNKRSFFAILAGYGCWIDGNINPRSCHQQLPIGRIDEMGLGIYSFVFRSVGIRDLLFRVAGKLVMIHCGESRFDRLRTAIPAAAQVKLLAFLLQLVFFR